MFVEKKRVSTGITRLDQRLDSLFIGDNVIWYDEAGSLVFPFTLNFIRESEQQGAPVIYVSFDRSPKSLLKALGPLALSSNMTILDCFTHGKGDGSDIFSKFYDTQNQQGPYRILKVSEPNKPENVADAIYGIHEKLNGHVHFIFESLTGMQDLWEGEESILKFYSRSCPHLYELETIAYWIIEKGAHSNRLKAQINRIAQVVIELSMRRGKSSLSIIKAQSRQRDNLNKAELFRLDGMTVAFDVDQPMTEKIDIGSRLRSLRKKQGVSQKGLAGLVGVTPSTISQIESNLIYPSIPALIKIAQAICVDVSYFFPQDDPEPKPLVFTGGGQPVHIPRLPKGAIAIRQLLPADVPADVEPYLLEMAPGRKLTAHFFNHKGEEFGYLLEGRLEVTVRNTVQHLRVGDIILLRRDIPTQWKNTGDTAARLLWMKIR